MPSLNRIILCTLSVFVFLNHTLSTPLDDYVNQPDSHFKYELIKTYELEGYKLFILNMTSQKWLDETLVQNPIWWHFLCVTVPDQIIRPDAAFLLIDGGDNNPQKF